MNLEDRFFYRLVKVAYYALLIPLSLIALTSGYDSIPTNHVDNYNSYLVCENGIYKFVDAGIYVTASKLKVLTGDNIYAANRQCFISEERAKFASSIPPSSDVPASIRHSPITRQAARAELQRRQMIKQENHPRYTLSVEYEREGAWKDVFFWWFVFTSILYAVLNIIQEALLYVAFGIKPTWVWLVHAKGAAITAINIMIEAFSPIKILINKKFSASWGEKAPL